jgi:hypothetical protein
MSISIQFRDWIENTPAPWKIGQVLIAPEPGGVKRFELRHVDDRHAETDSLRPVDDWIGLRELIRVNAAGEFRPLKAAPDLRSGWRMTGLDFDNLRLALDYFYPGAVADWICWRNGNLPVTSYAETAKRQSGRYHIARSLGEGDLEKLTQTVCERGCLKRRLWTAIPNSDAVEGSSSEIPLLCAEACNYFVGKAREKIKGPAVEE